MNAPTFGPLGRRGEHCVSDLRLDQWIAGELAGKPDEVARIETHLGECTRCSGRAEMLRGSQGMGAESDNQVLRVLPPLRGNSPLPLRGNRPPARFRSRTYVGALALAAAVMLTVYLGAKTGVTTREEIRTKGSAALTVYVNDSSGHTAPLASDVPVRAGSRLRFQVSSPQSAYVLMLGLDSAGHVSLYAPTSPDAEPPQLAPREQRVLDGSIELDDTPGAERLFALFCPTRPNPARVLEVAGSALSAAHNHPESIQVLGTSCLERTALVNKAAGPPR